MPLLKKRVWWDGVPKVVSRVLRPLDPMVVKGGEWTVRRREEEECELKKFREVNNLEISTIFKWSC